MNIYQEELMDHYEHPRNQGEVENPDLEVKESNASWWGYGSVGA